MRNRCNINSIDLNTGYYMQLPKILFSKEFREVKSDAKLIYALLRDRHQISFFKKMTNKKGEIFIIYPREKMAEILNISLPTARKAMKQLTEMGLIEEERQGLNKPNLIYLLKLDKNEEINDDWELGYEMYPKIEISEKTVENNNQEDKADIVAENMETSNVHDEKIISFQEIQDISDRKNLSVKEVKTNYFYANREKKLLSGEKEFFSPDRKNLSGSIIKRSLINSSLNNLSNHNDLMEKIKTQIDYSVICKNNKKELNLIVDVMAEALYSKNDIVVGKILRPIETVKQQLLSLNQFHIEYVIECLQESITEVRNIKQYILTALYNAPSTIDFYYDNKIKAMLG